MFPHKTTEIKYDQVFKHLVSDGCIRNAPGWIFFLSLVWQKTSVLLSSNLNFDLHIHGVSNALFQLVGV